MGRGGRNSGGGNGAVCAVGNLRSIAKILTTENFMESFPECMSDVICRSAKRVAVSPWAMGLPVTSISSYCLGPFSQVVITACDWTARPMNWSIAVSSSGGGKTQAWLKVQKAVNAFEQRLNDEAKERVLKYLQTGEVPEGSEQYEEEWRKAGYVKICVDGAVTFERLFNVLLQHKDHSGLLHLEEALQFFETLDCFKKGNVDRITALRMRGGGPWTRETVSDKDKRTCDFTHVVICGFTQPEPIAREIEKVPNDGLLNRWTLGFIPQLYPKFAQLRIASADQSQIKADEDRLAEVRQTATFRFKCDGLKEVFYRLYTLPHEEDGSPKKVTWILEGEAEVAFEKTHDLLQTVLETLHEDDQGEKGGFLAKAKGDALSLAGTFEAMMTVSDQNYPNNLSVGNVYKISESSVIWAWNYVKLLLRQRVHFENDPLVCRIVGDVLGWHSPVDESEDQPEADTLLTDMEKRAVKLFSDFRDAKAISRQEVSKKRKYGTVNDIDRLFRFISSPDDDGVHCFGSRKMAKKYPSKKVQPVFFKSIPEEDDAGYVEMVNKLTRIGMRFQDYHNRAAKTNEKIDDIDDAPLDDDEDEELRDGEEKEMEED